MSILGILICINTLYFYFDIRCTCALYLVYALIYCFRYPLLLLYLTIDMNIDEKSYKLDITADL